MRGVEFSSLVLGVGVFVGCDVGELESSAGALLNPEVSHLQAPGNRLLAGEFGEFWILQGFPLVVVGAYEEGGRRRLKIASSDEFDEEAYEDGSLPSCEGGTLTELTVSVTADSDFLGIVEDDPDGDSFGVVRFLGDDCQELLPTFEEVDLEVFHKYRWTGEVGYEEAWLILTRDGELRVVENDLTVTPGTAGVSHLSGWPPPGETVLFTIEDGQVVERDARTLEEIKRRHAGVTEFGLWGRLSHYRNEDGLYVERENAGSVFVGSEACIVGGGGTATNGSLLVRAPCEAPDLRLLEFEGDDIYQYVFPNLPGTLLSTYARAATVEFRYFVVAPFEDAQSGALWYAQLPADDGVSLAERAMAGEPLIAGEAQEVIPEQRGYGTRYLGRGYVVDWDGVSGQQAIIVDQLQGEIELGYEGLVAYGYSPSGRGSMLYYAGHADGMVDVHARDSETDEHTLLLERVAWTPFEEQLEDESSIDFGFPGPADAEAVVLGRRGAVGTMHFWDRLNAPQSPLEALSDAIDNNVRVDSFVPLYEGFGVAYLTGRSSDALRDPGTLKVYLNEEKLQITLHEDVVQTRAMLQPFGVAYLVRGGRDAGIWLARGR